jgi:Fe-S-cluster containining protein
MDSPIKPSLTDALCTRCGLCCDGSLFADVELASEDETSRLEILGLDIEDGENEAFGLLLQPCRALDGKRCSIYAHRPDCCRAFECRLFQQVKRGETSLDDAKKTIANALTQIKAIKALIGQLVANDDDEPLPLKERFADALALSEDFIDGPRADQKRLHLEKAMSSFENMIHRKFLGH